MRDLYEEQADGGGRVVVYVDRRDESRDRDGRYHDDARQ